MSHDPQSTLRPLSSVAVDLDALRASPARAGAVVRVARAAETVLRRMLRDDPTAPVDLRLKALAADDLSTDALLAELRRRDRLPMELAAAFHELTATAARLAAEGGEAAPRDGELALQVAEGLDRHVRAHPTDAPLEDPVLAGDETLIPPAADDREGVHPVPHVSRARPVWPWAAGALAVLLLVVAGIFLFGRRDSDALAQGVAAMRRNQTAEAEGHFRRAAQEDPEAPLPRYFLAQIYRLSGRRTEAAKELREGLAASPDDANLNTELGYLQAEMGRYDEAVESLRKAVLADSTSTRAWAGMVRTLRASGNHAQAERVLARAPANVRALLATARADSIAAAPPPIP